MSNRITRGGVSRTATISATSIPRDRELKSSCAPWFWLLQVSAVLESIRLSASVVARVRCRLRCCEKISNNFGGLSERVTTALERLTGFGCDRRVGVGGSRSRRPAVHIAGRWAANGGGVRGRSLCGFCCRERGDTTSTGRNVSASCLGRARRRQGRRKAFFYPCGW
jgi:hypothetical protein